MSSSWAVKYLGPQLLTKDGLKPTSEVIAGKKALAIYFSAHWCPPCRAFTPVLSDFYKTVSNDIAMVFVSSDSDEESFAEYYGSMSFDAIPFSEQDIIQSLGSEFSVEGIPSLIVVDPSDGSIKDEDGKQTVTTHIKDKATTGAVGVISKWTTI